MNLNETVTLILAYAYLGFLALTVVSATIVETGLWLQRRKDRKASASSTTVLTVSPTTMAGLPPSWVKVQEEVAPKKKGLTIPPFFKNLNVLFLF